MSRFSDTLMEYFQSPANREQMDGSDLVGRHSLDGHPPFVVLYLRIDGRKTVSGTESLQVKAMKQTISIASKSLISPHG